MIRTRAVFLDHATVDLGDLDLAALRATPYEWDFIPRCDATATAEQIRGAEVVITNKVVLDRPLLAEAKDLRLICIIATGTNNVDLEAAAEYGIAVTNVTGYGTPSVVQHVFALILALTTRLFELRAAVEGEEWQRSDMFCLLDYPVREISGKTLGIVGYGELGRATARVAEAFGMKVLLAQRPGGAPQEGRLPLNELLPRVDILSLHCPLTPETERLVNASRLALAKPDAFLINTSRGPLVDAAALAAALRNDQLGGAALDVLDAEPPAADNPLLSAPNCIITPHIAWYAAEARRRLMQIAADNLQAFINGTPLNVVNA